MRTFSFGGILNVEEIGQITEAFSPQSLRPGEHFLWQGRLCDKLAFIDKGILRVYLSKDDGQEATKYFMRRNQFAMDLESFYNNSPADVGIQAVVDTCLLVIDRAGWQRLCEAVPKFFILTKSLTEVALLNKIKDNDYLHFGTARQKYHEFTRRYPDLALTVPLQYIASYLQITPQSLSRIRKMR